MVIFMNFMALKTVSHIQIWDQHLQHRSSFLYIIYFAFIHTKYLLGFYHFSAEASAKLKPVQVSMQVFHCECEDIKKDRKWCLKHAKSQGQELNPHQDLAPLPLSPCIRLCGVWCVCVCMAQTHYSASWLMFEDQVRSFSLHINVLSSRLIASKEDYICFFSLIKLFYINQPYPSVIDAQLQYIQSI